MPSLLGLRGFVGFLCPCIDMVVEMLSELFDSGLILLCIFMAEIL